MENEEKYYIKALGPDNTAYLFWMIGAILWILGFLYVNENSIDIFSSNLSRGFSLLLFNIVYLYFPHKSSQYEKKEATSFRLIFFTTVRHLILSIYGYAFAEAQFYLPPPVIYTIYFSGPLFVVSLDYLIFKITITSKQMKGVIISFIGVILASNGQLIMTTILGEQGEFTTKFKNYKTDSFIVKSLVGVGMIIMTIGWSCAAILSRKLKPVSTFQCNFNFGYVLTILAAILYQFADVQKDFENNQLLFFKCVLFQGLILSVCQVFFMHALLITTKVGIMTMVGFVGVVFSYFLSIFRYKEEVSYLCVTGTILVIYGVSQIVLK